MSQVLPPMKPPGLGCTESDGGNRIRFRLYQIALAAATLVITGWFCTMGVLPAIITLITAKHILVAILVAGLNYPPGRKSH